MSNNQAKAEDAVNKSANKAHDTIDKVADAAKHASDNLGEKGHNLKETQEKWLSTATDYVKDNPIKSLGIAAASGYLLSRLFSDRS
ncbi:DUF883 family protein [Idiomarina loihiensis]|jgi:ElaB/YqjD/DUF883 family membrane-anchored ribosome-binding protein|uniref:Uncharacterized conserved protein, ElaB family n=1 Tax=Idiomarina loihiensis (strain ATCC BAA-735 / DSM 15497 / L2-TR) TaxID=283942 RepID=Q5QU82_IDILO|nr:MULTISPECIES: DUF883 family protein [Idiomarina]NWO03037.1 DUF883 family protein [Idiomarinaceae bacterium]AAV82396.1 Uncharacterized conserved protein, ElaB family [Idiomarina loihiensis L2TR]AGM36430.1 hypothetical protein K734_07835 [Idiomarina loihiensis GSL 199]MBL4857528.1 DUF883 family protein [Idiomarina sp.]MRJ44206.1 DUF883 family protein [Idiomarina loihiensis]